MKIVSPEIGLRVGPESSAESGTTARSARGALSLGRNRERLAPLQLGLLSFRIDPNEKGRKESLRGNEHIVADILKTSPGLDILVCSGWTVSGHDELDSLIRSNENTKTVCFLETATRPDGTLNHVGYALRGQTLLIDETDQIFATSKEIGSNREKMLRFLTEFEERRSLCVGGRTVRWLICGEINVLRNIQRESNRVVFRHDEDRDLKVHFSRIFEMTDIFVNPTHTTMGNQGKLARRREFLSRTGRVFCSTSNVDESKTLDGKSVQYCWKNCKAVDETNVRQDTKFILRTYSI